jgi:uncharacterized protein
MPSLPAPPAGTQIVVHAPVLGSHGTVVHPRGAVGVITRTPVAGEVHFLVRFPDGFETSLTRDGFDILRDFRARLGLETAEADAGGRFDLESMVMLRCVIGSRAYGLETEASDTDRRGVYLAPAALEWSLFGAPEQFEDNDGQWVLWELKKFLVMALKANPNILETLYSPLVDHVTPLGERLLSIREAFLSQMIYQTFNGYAMSQFKKLEQDRRSLGTVRWKHAMHLIRLLLTGAATLRLGRVPVQVEAHREALLSIKRGGVPWEEVDAWRIALHEDFSRALTETKLPERPDYEAANTFLIAARREAASHFSQP